MAKLTKAARARRLYRIGGRTIYQIAKLLDTPYSAVAAAVKRIKA